MLFARAGKYEPCGIFTSDHFKLIGLTIIGIAVALAKTANKTKEEVTEIIKKCTIFIWIFEAIIMSFKLAIGNIKNVGSYLPLYYCSLLLYAGGLSSFAKNNLKRMGDVFLATGSIIGGIIFMLLPTTSLLTYPMFHIISIYSFIFHGIMIYLGILVNITNYIELKASDIKYYAILVGAICLIALIVNNIFDSNLMFISKDFPGTPITVIYHLLGKFFTPLAIISQMTIPFIFMYIILKIKYLLTNKKSLEKEI